MSFGDERVRCKPLVSVIIPIYMIDRYVGICVESVINQTYTNLEIVIVDDGSTDGSGGICDEYAQRDRRIRVIHQENRGLSAARNTGLDKVSGEYIAFLDSDDAYRPDYVETMMRFMISDEPDLVLSRYEDCRTTGKLEGNGGKDGGKEVHPSILPGVYDRAGALRGLAEGTISPNIWNRIYRRKLWNSIRFR